MKSIYVVMSQTGTILSKMFIIVFIPPNIIIAVIKVRTSPITKVLIFTNCLNDVVIVFV